ncbi:hypothetical protein Pan241w_07500 [Gimesia alba]|uniref:Uncharacterized protein n=1 Tax=Gimesia alba TaxID=2527973 RepID=A0A517R9W8_9PLAN|nr:hypothetical protein [Gimesia alba]QDT40692.1 hypothetical protein Pan241w_07500 [Gimesia alba]
MNSQSKPNFFRRHRRGLAITAVVLGVYWWMTWTWGMTQVHQYYVDLNRQGLPPQAQVYDDHRPADLESNWCLVGYPHAPFPGIVSLEIDMRGCDIWWSAQRIYFFWCPGYHSKVPFWGRSVAGTYEETE